MPAAWRVRIASRSSARGSARGRQARVWRQEGDRVVAPVVDLATIEHEARRQLLLHRQQLDRGDAELGQVGDRRRMGESRVRAAQRLRDVGMAGA